MPNPHLPTDGNNNPIPVMSFVPGGSQQVAIGAASQRNAVAFPIGTKVVTLKPSIDCRIRFGDSTVTAVSTDSLLSAGVDYDISIQPDDQTFYPNVSVISASAATGTLEISLRA